MIKRIDREVPISQVKKTSKWVVYDPKLNGIHEFSNKEIKGYLLEHTHKLVGRFMDIELHGKTWVDFIINSDFLK